MDVRKVEGTDEQGETVTAYVIPDGYRTSEKCRVPVESGLHKAAPRDWNRRGHGTGSEVPMQRDFSACEHCGEEYVPTHSKQRYCSLACSGDARKESRVPVAERFWRFVTPSAPDECWEWQGFRSNGGYGKIGSGGKYGDSLIAHRVSYEIHVGPIPEGLQIDHLCRNRCCVNPAHLEPVTTAENLRRGGEARKAERTHCRNGHPWVDIYVDPNGKRTCRACRRLTDQRLRKAGLR